MGSKGTAERLAEVIGNVEAELDQRAAQTEIQAGMLEYEDPNGKWRHAPAEAKHEARAAIIAEQRKRAEIAVWHLGKALHDIAPIHHEAVEAVKAPPSPEAAFAKRHGLPAVDPALGVQLDIREELKQDRLLKTLGQAKPSQVAAAYQQAVETGDDATIRFVESRHLRGWSGAPSSDKAEAEAAQALASAIKAQRESRIPPEAHRVSAALSKARRLYDRAQTIHRLSPRKPSEL